MLQFHGMLNHNEVRVKYNMLKIAAKTPINLTRKLKICLEYLLLKPQIKPGILMKHDYLFRIKGKFVSRNTSIRTKVRAVFHLRKWKEDRLFYHHESIDLVSDF